MTEAERAEKAKVWDARTPLQRLKSLSTKEQNAFLALFAGGRCNLQGAYRADTGQTIPVSFGKAECEWVDFDLWRYKLPGLRLTNYSEGPRRVALGMAPGSVVWDITIEVTEDGWEARNAYWDQWQKDVHGDD